MAGFVYALDGDDTPKFKFSIEELQRIEANEWLTDRERIVFGLYYKRGWDIERIAAELDVNRSTIARDLKKIRGKTIKSYL